MYMPASFGGHRYYRNQDINSYWEISIHIELYAFDVKAIKERQAFIRKSLHIHFCNKEVMGDAVESLRKDCYKLHQQIYFANLDYTFFIISNTFMSSIRIKLLKN